jgi:signal transduction histidine kinase/streptogramin lyase
MRDGLAGGLVQSIAQTPDGYLWIAGYGGVARFDGARIIRMELEPPQDIAGVAADVTGVLNMAPRRGPALCARGAALADCPGPRPALPANLRTFALSRDRLGALWAGTDTGAYRLTGPAASAAESAAVEGAFGELTAIRRDGQGRLWLGGTTGLFMVEDGQPRAAQLDGRAVEGPVRSIHERSNGQLWALNDLTLLSIDDRRITGHALPRDAPGGPSSEVIEDRDGNVWIGTPRGLLRFRGGRFDVYTKRDGLPDDDVTAVFEDREGSLWVGTRGGNVAQFTERTVSTKYGPPSLLGESIESVSEDAEGAMWFGTRLGLTRWKDGVERTFSRADGVPGERVFATYPGRRGEVWVGTSAGLILWRQDRPEQPFPQPLTEPVFSLYVDRAGTLWIGTGTGLVRARDGNLERLEAEGQFRPGQVRGIQEDDGGVLWVTSFGGMGRVEGGKLRRVSDPRVPDVMRADRGISRDPGGTLWFGAGTSLVRLDGGRFRAFSAAEGLPRDWLFQVLADNHGALWFGTSRTISRVTLRDLEEVDTGRRSLVAVTTFGSTDNRQEIAARRSRTPGAWKSRDGRLWFATLHGVVTIVPEQIRINQLPPPVVIEKATVNGVPADPGTMNEFPPGPGNIEIQYAGVTLLESRKMLHRYKLEGFDPGWVDAGTRRVASYANIPPGGYRFRVQASNADGIWNHEGAVVELRLLPHFYRTGWFYALGAGTLLGMAFLLYRARLLRLRGQYLAVFAERSRVARELHDSLLQGMSAVALEIENIRGQIPPSAADAVRRLTSVQDALTSSLEDTRRFVWNLREQPTASSDLGLALTRLCGRLTEGKVVSCPVNVEGQPKHLSHDVQGTVFSVAQEAVANALKHADPGRIEVTLTYEREVVKLLVADDGGGFAVASAQGPGQGHFGLLGMRERARRMGAHLLVESEPGAGTRVQLTVPLSARSPVDV